MKIAIVSKQISRNSHNLVGLYREGLLSVLRAHGVEVTVLTTHDSGEEKDGGLTAEGIRSFPVYPEGQENLQTFKVSSKQGSLLSRWDERLLIEDSGLSFALIEHIQQSEHEFDQFIFLSLDDPHSLVGPLVVPEKSLFIPLFDSDVWSRLPSVMRIMAYVRRIGCGTPGELAALESMFGGSLGSKGFVLGFPGDVLAASDVAPLDDGMGPITLGSSCDRMMTESILALKSGRTIIGSQKSISHLADLSESFGGYLDEASSNLSSGSSVLRRDNALNYFSFLTDGEKYWNRLLSHLPQFPSTLTGAETQLPEKRVVLAYKYIGRYDAVGFDIIKQVETLRLSGYKVFVYCEACDEELKPYKIELPLLLDIVGDPAALLIYHYAIHWPEFDKILIQTKCKRMMKYHNITPAEFFSPYSEDLASECYRARRSLESLVRTQQFDFYTSDSKFNQDELLAYGVDEKICRIISPFHKSENLLLTKINRDLKALHKPRSLHVLSVGRMAPNKNHLELLAAVNRYVKQYDSNISVFIVGGLDGRLSGYQAEVEDAIARYRLKNIVTMFGKLSHQDLATLYLISDLLAITSQHEGFCVPVVEAQVNLIPTVSYRAAALPETINCKALTCEVGDYKALTDSMWKYRSLSRESEFIKSYSFQSKRFQNGISRSIFSEVVEQILGN